MTDDAAYRQAVATERRVQTAAPELEREIGPFEVAIDEDDRVILTAHSGGQFVARLSSRHADARLVIEEVAR